MLYIKELAQKSQFKMLVLHSWKQLSVKWTWFELKQGLHSGSDSKESTCNAEDSGSVPGLRRSPGEENGYSLQYSCLENPMDREAWWATVHGVAESNMTEHLTLSSLLYFMIYTGFLSGSVVKNPPANSGDMWDTQVLSLGWEDPVE